MSARVYLAGPDVFFSEAKKRAEVLKTICAEYGLEGVFPLDADIAFTDAMSGPEKARLIFDANVALIKSCRGVLANMMPFRGPSMDVGTAWEMGFAHALGLPVVGYTSDGRLYEDRVTPDEYMIERFGGIDNLMLTEGVRACKTPKNGAPMVSAIREMAVILGFEIYG
jgi:nucleoside 2-deoxyribosyltransferase